VVPPAGLMIISRYMNLKVFNFFGIKLYPEMYPHKEILKAGVAFDLEGACI